MSSPSGGPGVCWRRLSLRSLFVLTALASAGWFWIYSHKSAFDREQQALAVLLPKVPIDNIRHAWRGPAWLEGWGEFGGIFQRVVAIDLVEVNDDPHNYYALGELQSLAAFASLEDVCIACIEDAPMALAALQSSKHALRRLVVSRGRMDDASLELISQFSRLEVLEMGDCGNSDGFTTRGLTALARLRCLKRLTLATPSVTDEAMASISQLTSLEFLSLHCPISNAGLAKLRTLTRLEELDIRITKVTGAGLGALRDMRQLKKLDLDGMPIENSDLLAIGDLESLECLSLRSTGITSAGLSHLSRLHALRYLRLSHTLIMSDNLIHGGLSQLAKLPSLESLELLRMDLRDSDLCALCSAPRLRRLCAMVFTGGECGQKLREANPQLKISGDYLNEFP